MSLASMKRAAAAVQADGKVYFSEPGVYICTLRSLVKATARNAARESSPFPVIAAQFEVVDSEGIGDPDFEPHPVGYVCKKVIICKTDRTDQEAAKMFQGCTGVNAMDIETEAEYEKFFEDDGAAEVAKGNFVQVTVTLSAPESTDQNGQRWRNTSFKFIGQP